MNKPIATLGDVLTAKGADVDWRAQMRASDIPRRPAPSSSRGAEPPQSRPDRGYVEQPEERVNTTVFPPRPKPTPQPPQRLVRFTRNMMQEDGHSLDESEPPKREPPPPPPPPAELMAPEPPTQVPPPTTVDPIRQLIANEMASRLGEPAMPAKAARKTRTVLPEADKIRYASLLIQGKRTTADITRETTVSKSAVLRWPDVYGRQARALIKAEGRASEQSPTLVSSPVSGPVSVAPATSAVPPAPSLSLSGLEEYIRALVRKEVGIELKRRLGDD